MAVEHLWILLILPIVLIWLYGRRKKSFLLFPSVDLVPDRWTGRIMSPLFKVTPILLLLLLALLASGLRFPLREGLKYGYGSDIVFLLDESGSMVEAFEGGPGRLRPERDEPNKFSVAKRVISRFMEMRKEGRDRYGLTVFGSSAIRVLPLTFNHQLFLRCLAAQEPVLQSTLFAPPMAFGVEELMRSTARSRVLVLVTDGAGSLEDDRYGFSKIITRYGIRCYWISIATDNFEDLPRFLAKIGPLGKKIDAANPSQLEAGFAEIHSLERSVITYHSSNTVLNPKPMIYSVFFFMTLLWAFHSVLVYHRKA